MFKNQVARLVALPILSFVYMPRPPIEGSHFLLYPIITFLLSGVLLLLLTGRDTKKKIKVPSKRIVLITLFLLFFTISLIISFLVNSQEIRVTALAEIGRSILLGTILIYGYTIANIDHYKCKDGLLVANYFILFGQTIIGILQIISPELVNPLYSIEKLYSLNSIRMTGSIANPNLFGWLVSFTTISIYLLEEKKIKYLFLLIGTVLVFLSGSRTIIMLYPIMFIIANIKNISCPRKVSSRAMQRVIIQIFFVFLFIILILSLIIYVIPKYSPYFALLIEKIVNSGELKDLNSFDARLNHWENIYNTYFSDMKALSWFFGIGSRPIVRVVDNDFLYVFYRTGLIGLSIHLLTIFYSLLIFIKTSKLSIVGVLGKNYIIYSLMFGIMFDHLGGWYAPILWFLFLGLSLGIIETENRVNSFNREKKYAQYSSS